MFNLQRSLASGAHA